MRAAIDSFLGSPRGSLAAGIQDSGSGISFLRRSRSTLLPPGPWCAAALHLETEEGHLLRRVRSEPDNVGSTRPARAGLRYPNPARVGDKEEEADLEVKWFDLGVPVPARPPAPSRTPAPTGRKTGGGRGRGEGGDQNDNRRIADYYRQMLRSDPSNPLLLRNYGRFLHEVEGDAKGAEECYGRAMLASPEDGELLSLFGKLVWEIHGDGKRAEAYFERAVKASPDNCYVVGSYAQFLWDAEEEEEGGGGGVLMSVDDVASDLIRR